MHIAHLHWAFPPVIGGVESHLAMLGPELFKNNCRVSLLTGLVEGTKAEDWYEGMYIRRTPLMDLNSLTPERIAGQRQALKQVLDDFIEQVQPDVIHAHNMHYFSPVHADVLAEIKESRGIPLVLTAHNVWLDDDPLWQEMNKRASIWDAVIAVSDYIKRELVRVGYEEKRVVAIHHGIDLNRFQPVTEADQAQLKTKYPEFAGRRVIFHPARMSLDKGCHISVKALDKIRRKFPDVLLVLAGTAKTVDWGSVHQKHVQTVMNLVSELGLEEHVYVQFFAWEDMPLVYKAAEFCIYPSCFEEPFGLVMLESMATEKPIIVSRAGGMPEIIHNGVNGFVVEMKNAEQLAEQCCQLLENPVQCRQMGKHGRAMVEAYWTKEVMTETTLAVYKNLKLDTTKLSGNIKLA